jgi:hypothetical protein
MPEAGNLLLPRELGADELIDALPCCGLAELEEHLHHFGVRAAVERALERADGRDDCRIDIRQCRGSHAAGKTSTH